MDASVPMVPSALPDEANLWCCRNGALQRSKLDEFYMELTAYGVYSLLQESPVQKHGQVANDRSQSLSTHDPGSTACLKLLRPPPPGLVSASSAFIMSPHNIAGELPRGGLVKSAHS